MYEWDNNKNKLNAEKHGVSFDEMDGFDWDSAVVNSDNRHDEKRLIAIGYIGDRLYVVVFALRGEKVRVISLRKANEREQKRYSNV